MNPLRESNLFVVVNIVIKRNYKTFAVKVSESFLLAASQKEWEQSTICVFRAMLDNGAGGNK